MEESPPEVTPEAAAKKMVLRFGWCTVGLGVGSAVVAAAIGGANADSSMAGATALQRVGALIMLLGLVVVLAAYRVAWLTTRWRGRVSGRMSTEPADFSRAFLRLMQFSCIGVPVTIVVVALPWIVLAVIPDVAAGIVIVPASLLTPIVLTTIVVYGRGYLRTFCIGALFPAAVFFIAMGLSYPRMIGRWPRTYSMRPYHSIWSSFEEIGETAHFAGFVWTFVILSGLLAMGTRFLIAGPWRGSRTALLVENAESPDAGQPEADYG